MLSFSFQVSTAFLSSIKAYVLSTPDQPVLNIYVISLRDNQINLDKAVVIFLSVLANEYLCLHI